MKTIDPGHVYELSTLDGDEDCRLTFVKREGAGYPGNGGHWAGTTTQEVLRACEDRLGYVNNQIACAETEIARQLVVSAIFLLETRNARLKNRAVESGSADSFMASPLCQACLHVGCPGDCRALKARA